MNDKSALLGQLKIEREPTRPPRKRAGWILAMLAFVGLVALLVSWFRPLPAAPVKVTTVRALGGAGNADSVLDASGYVVARRQATVSSKVTGKVIELLIEEGQNVQEGEVLARIDDSNARASQSLARSQIDEARAALTEVRVQLAEAERQLRRNRELAARNLVATATLETAQAQVDQLKARLESTQRGVSVAQASLEVQNRLVEDTVVRAPFAGVITVKNAQEGEMISPLSAGGEGTRTGIGTLVDMDSLEVEVDVNENFINRVEAGQPVQATLNAYPDWKIPAEVIAVIPTADRAKATVKVRVRLNVKNDPRVIPDMGARVSFLSAPKTEGEAQAARPLLLLAREAVAQDAGGPAVYVIRGDEVERRAVKLGSARGPDVEITAGLSGGESVALGDLAQLADGAKIRIEEQ